MSTSQKLSSGYEIPSLGLGFYLTAAEEAFDTIYKGLEIGYRHFDSAQFYENEQQVVDGISKYLKNHPDLKRSEIFYTTKVNPFSATDYETAKKSIEESLEKAKDLGYIDLVLIHGPHGGPTARLGSYKALQEYVELGKIKSIGVSNYGIHHLEELFNWPGLKIKPAVNQIELSPWLTRKELIEYMNSKNIAAQAFSPLTRGFKLGDPQLLEIAAKYHKTPAQVLLRWSLQKGFIVLAKSVKEERLIENFDIFNWELSQEDFKALTHDEDYFICIPHWDPSKNDLSQ